MPSCLFIPSKLFLHYFSHGITKNFYWVGLTANHLLRVESINLLWIILWVLEDNEFFHIYWFNSFSLANIPYFNCMFIFWRQLTLPLIAVFLETPGTFSFILYSSVWKTSSLNLCYLMGHHTEEGKGCCLDHNLLSTSTWPMRDMAFPFLSPLQCSGCCIAFE